MEVDSLLRVEPELGRGPEGGSELEGHFGSHGGPTVHDAVDHLDVAGEMIRQLPLRHPERNQELFAENLTRGWSAAGVERLLSSGLLSGSPGCRPGIPVKGIALQTRLRFSSRVSRWHEGFPSRSRPSGSPRCSPRAGVAPDDRGAGS